MFVTLSSVLIGAVIACGTATAQQVVVTVRVVSRDAKIIGSGVGGARVIIRNAVTGQVLASGSQEGGTGNTGRIVRDPHVRGELIYDGPDAARFTATIAIDTPTVVEVIGEGPLGIAHAMQRAMKSVLLVPGQDIMGDGIVLELHGFIVEVLQPTSLSRDMTTVVARVRMLCGCPLTPGGLWDADRVVVEANVFQDGRLVRRAPLAYAGEENMFSGKISLADLPAGAALVVIAVDPTRVNFGRSVARLLPAR